MAEPNINFDGLVNRIQTTNEALQNNARLVINRHVTAKAWLTGYYIVEYEQNGSDRAKYGEQLLQKLAERLGKGTTYRTLRLYRLFFLTYRNLIVPVADFVVKSLPIWQSTIAKLETNVFISKYELSIPSKERMAEFLRKENEGLNREDEK